MIKLGKAQIFTGWAAIPLIRLQQLIQCLSVELVVAEVQGGVDGFEGLKIYIELLLLVVLRHDGPRVDDQAVRRHLFQPIALSQESLPGLRQTRNGMCISELGSLHMAAPVVLSRLQSWCFCRLRSQLQFTDS